MKKRILTLILTGMVCAGILAGCGGSGNGADNSIQNSDAPAQSDLSADDGADGDLLLQIQDKGELVIATEGTWSPWTFHDEENELVGFDVELGKAIAGKLGVEAVFAETKWDSIFAGLNGGRYDIVINGVDITPERSEKYDFTKPYAYQKTAIIVKEDNEDIHSLEDLNGKTTANTLQSVYAQLAEEYGATPTGVDDLNQTIELLLAGRIDATLNAELTFYDYKKEHPDAPIRIAAVTDDANEIAIPMRKGDDTAALRAALDQAIDELREDGTLSELSQKYFDLDITSR